MSRRFALSTTEMTVLINGTPLQRFQVPTKFRFPPNAVPDGATIEGDFVLETVGQKQVRWWMGFTPVPVEEEDLRGVSVIAHGKMAQRPFMFQRGGGVTSQLGQEYLVGEVIADWIDDDADVTGDLIATNRAELMLEDARLADFLEWRRARVNWALRTRQNLVEKENVERLELSAEVQRRLADFTPTEQRVFKNIGARLSRLPEVRPQQVEELMVDLMDGHSDKAVRGMIEAITATDPQQQDAIWPLVQEFGLIDARRLKSIIEARLEVIRKLRQLVQEGAREVPEIHQHVKDNYWLIDPRWQLIDDEVELTGLLENEFRVNQADGDGMRLDFVYCLGPRFPAPRDVVFLVEIKRGTIRDGTRRRVTSAELHRFHDYYVYLDTYLRKLETHPPSLKGIMIAADYEQQALPVKTSLEQLGLEFKSWDSVLDGTERLHVGWLELSRSRAEIPTASLNE